MVQQDYEWAEALRKAQHTAKQNIPTVGFSFEPKISLEQLQEQMNYYKEKLKEALKTKNTAEIQNLIDRIINNHARQTAFLIKKEKSLGAKDTSPTIDAHLQKYFSDCKKLLQIIPS